MTFGSYKVVRELGKCGMREFYEVENVRLGSRHALKLFRNSVSQVKSRIDTCIVAVGRELVAGVK